MPIQKRSIEQGEFSSFTELSPFGDKHVVLPGGTLQLEMTDATATDAAVSDDTVQMTASWEDKEGNTYTVKCCDQMATVGPEHPTFGGVVTNHILHGASQIGTPLMPTEYTYAAFWGMGEVQKNGETLDKPRLIHGMLTEYVRKEDYKLAFDNEVTPTRRHFHVMVPPKMPAEGETAFEDKPVKTGFQLPNGNELPFWHVMFESLDIEADRG